MNNEINETEVILDRAVKDKVFRLGLVCSSLFWFLHIYFPDYLNYKIADFQKEIIGILEDEGINNFILAAFRGSGKSTIISLAYVLWSMVGWQNKRFIVLISNTTKQAESLLYGVKDALERNNLLKSDLGPFYEVADEWKSSSLIFKNYDAKIMATSVNESIRGIRYKNVRPQLIICDDVETLETIRSEEGRDKLITWFDRDIVPLGDESTKILVLGTILASGALLLTLSDRIEQGLFKAIFRKYPIINDSGEVLWKNRWKTPKDVEEFRKKMGITERIWQTEYLLNEWIREEQIISPDMIHYYDPAKFDVPPDYRETIISVDFAVTESQSADFTAIVSGDMYGYRDELKLYILPNALNRKLEYPKVRSLIKEVYENFIEIGKSPVLYLEVAGQQKGFLQDLQNDGYSAKAFSPGTKDKVARLTRASNAISTGQVLFPCTGASNLINQIVNFNVVKQHDDLVDACVMAISYMLEAKRRRAIAFTKKPQGW